MSEKELLVAAAKAAGIRLHVWGTKGKENYADMDSGPCGGLWNPLLSDADALRLVVKLNMTVSVTNTGRMTTVAIGGTSVWIQVDHKKDPEAATRRAITEAAAAAIGAAK